LGAIAAVLPGGFVIRPGGALAASLLSSENCRSVLRQAIPLLGLDLEGAVSPESPGGIAETNGYGFTGLVFGSLTGISLGEPTSFLTANLPLARSAYTGAILASGREAEAPVTAPPGTGSDGAPGTGSDGGPGTGSDGGPGTGSDGEVGVVGDGRARLWLYGSGAPLLAIVHTHASESFLPAVEALARAKDPDVDLAALESFTADATANLLRVGEELAHYVSTTYGISVVQSRRLHDAQADGFRLGAYERSLETMTEILRRYPTVSVLLDLHRDAPSREKTTATIKGVPTATICAIVGTDRLLDNPYTKANYDFACRLMAAMDLSYPGLARGILVRDERYNQHVMERTVLLEIGGQENTLEEVFASVRALGDVLGQIMAEGLDPP
jgi:stage II sporulation protein P